MERNKLKLDILISTYGPEGIRRVASHSHPAVEGVRYVVCWQKGGDEPLPDSLAHRTDFEIFRYDDTGSARNRNHTLERFEAPLGMLSDDDIDYTAEEIEGVMECYASHPGVDMLFFKFHSVAFEKEYHDFEFDFRHAPKFYYYCNFEMTFRREAVKNKVWFDERFGLNSPFLAGEEDIFVLRALKSGAVIHFVPQYNSRHDGSTTSDREGESDEMLRTCGAVLRAFHPWTFWARILVHAGRRTCKERSFMRFVAICMKGAWDEYFTR